MSGVKKSRADSNRKRRHRSRYERNRPESSRHTVQPFAQPFFGAPLPLGAAGGGINEAYYGPCSPHRPPLAHAMHADPMRHVPEYPPPAYSPYAGYYPPMPPSHYYRSAYMAGAAGYPYPYHERPAEAYSSGEDEDDEDEEEEEAGKRRVVGRVRKFKEVGDTAEKGVVKRKTKKKRRTCDFKDCTKFAQGNTKRCVKHGGGNRCQHKDCTKSAAGTTRFCISHGGGKRCSKENCPKSAIPPDNFCFAHGGGKRCAVEGCQKGARGVTKYCIAHGGGRRCQVFQCRKSDQGGGYCIAHGGGKKGAATRAAKSPGIKRKPSTGVKSR